MKATKRKSTGQRVSVADIYRLGPQVAEIKRRTDPKTWKQIVRDAHKRGLTVAGALSDAPDPLRERTKRSLLEQAKKTVASAYDPAGRELDEQERRTRALDAKRARDEEVYQSWLGQRQAEIASQARESQRRYEEYQTGLAEATSAAWQGAQTNAQQMAQAREGTVSNMKDATAVKDLGADQKAAEGMVDAARKETAALLPSVEGQINNTSQQMLAMVAAQKAKRQGETNEKLNQIFDTRLKLKTDRAGEEVKEYSRLLDNEQAKAMSNREYGALAERIGVQQANATTAAVRAAETVRKNKQAEEDRKRERELKRAKLRLDKGKADLNSDGKVDSRDYALKRRIDEQTKAAYKSKGEKKKVTDSQRSASRKKVERISTIAGLLEDWNAPGGAPRTRDDKRPLKPSEFRHRLRQEQASDLEIDVAEAVRKARARGLKKLPKRAYDKAKQLGILNPDDLL